MAGEQQRVQHQRMSLAPAVALACAQPLVPCHPKSRWFTQWCQHTGFAYDPAHKRARVEALEQPGPRPGPIDNSDLLAPPPVGWDDGARWRRCWVESCAVLLCLCLAVGSPDTWGVAGGVAVWRAVDAGTAAAPIPLQWGLLGCCWPAAMHDSVWRAAGGRGAPRALPCSVSRCPMLPLRLRPCSPHPT